MNKNEIVKNLKQNERAYKFLSDEEKEVMDEAIKLNSVFVLNVHGKSVYVGAGLTTAMLGGVYQINTDYQPPEEAEGEIIKCEIFTEEFVINNKLPRKFFNYNHMDYMISEALDIGSIGFLDSDGFVSPSWHVGYVDTTGKRLRACSYSDLAAGRVEDIHATHVLFRKEK